MIKKHLRSGLKAQQNDLINIAQLTSLYYKLEPEIDDINCKVKFGTSGHRGSSMYQSFNELHIIAITQAIIKIRKKNNIHGPCYVGKDTHALSEPAMISVLEVLSANNIYIIIENNNGYTPTPSISNAIIEYNKNHEIKADGIILTSSHNPPEDGGIKYNFSNGGPADYNITRSIENYANIIIKKNLYKKIKRWTYKKALISGYIKEKNLMEPYVKNLSKIVNIKAIQNIKLNIAVNPFGGAGLEYWNRISEYYKLDFKILNNSIDQTFRFMRLDYDGTIRIDCTSKNVISGLLSIRKKFDLIFTNDPDHDRHSIITPHNLLNPNDYFIVAINYLFNHRSKWLNHLAIGKTIVSSSIIDFIAQYINRNLFEVPVGFKNFSDGLYKGNLGFCGEESSGASFLRFDGKPWSTDKDGIIMCLLAAEIVAVTEHNLKENLDIIKNKLKTSYYNCLQKKSNNKQKVFLSNLSSNIIKKNVLAGDKIIKYLKLASGNKKLIQGIKIITKNGWLVIRPSGTENIYKIYSESFLSEIHRKKIEKEGLNLIHEISKKN